MSSDSRSGGLEALRHVAHVQVTAQAICKARQHLPLELLKTLVEAVAERHKGDCWDNAVTESFWASLKCELMDHKPFITFLENKSQMTCRRASQGGFEASGFVIYFRESL